MLDRKIAPTVLAALVAFGLMGPVAAPAQVLGLEFLSVSEIIGRQVTGPRGEDLGRIRDLVIDSRTRKVEYVALGHGAEQLVTFPVSSLRVAGTAQVMLDVPPDSLSQSSSAGASIAQLTEKQARRLIRASELMVGRVKDLVVSVLDGDIRFALLDTAGDGTRLRVPVESIEELTRQPRP